MNLHLRECQLALIAALDKAGFNRRIWVNSDPSVPKDQLLALAKQFGQNDPYDTYIIAQLGRAKSQRNPLERVRGWLSDLTNS